MLYDSQVWPLKERNINRISQTDMQMVQWMCNVSLRDRTLSAELRNTLGVANLTDLLRQKKNEVISAC